MVRRNQFIDDDNLSELSSLTHLLERNDNDDNEETPVLQHSPYYSDNQFIDIISKDTGLSILDMNICNAFTKFDELEIFIQRVNVSNPVSIICLNECWLSDQSDVSIRVGKMPAFMSKVHAGGIYRYLPAFTRIYRRLLEFTGVY